MKRWLPKLAVAAVVVSFSPVIHALDWSHPWQEPQSSADAAQHSDEYAWRIFVALNWPASKNAERRQTGATADAPQTGSLADRRQRLGSQSRTVWESWSSANDIFRPDGADPGPWSRTPDPWSPTTSDAKAPHLAASTVPISSTRFEAFSARDLSNLQRVQNGKMVPVQDPLASIDRLTEIHMNRAGYEYIRAQGLYNTEGQLRVLNNGATVTFPADTKEVKAKWRVISEAERGRYYTLSVALAHGTERLYGLTALHVVTKDLPNWFWATFEHVDNPQLAGNDGWHAPSRDSFACGGADPGCNRAPSGIGLEGTFWQNYRLRGTLTAFVDSAGRPNLLANSELEAGMQPTASCITCHSRAGIGSVDGQPIRLPIFDTSSGSQPDPHPKRGFIGIPREEWFEYGRIQRLDFVWSMSKAKPSAPGAEK